MIRAYELQRSARGLPATYEILYGAAFAPESEPRGKGRGSALPGEQVIPVSALRPARR
jgi:hypothetical protein